MSQPINVVIPTRERADTLHHALATVVGQDCDRLKIWVSDNASSAETREVVEAFADPRITYLNTGKRLSMSHNYDFALSHVREGWIVMIGDDDGLLPDRLEPAVAELEAAGLSVASTEPCFYNWPGSTPVEKVQLTVPLDKTTAVIGGRDAIGRMLRHHWHDFKMPQTYTGGIVHADVVNRVRAVKGTFFQSQIPDVFSGYAICSTVENFLFTRKPFTLAGRSSHSIGAQLFAMQKPTFLDEGLIPFHEDFPLPEGGTLTFSMPAMIYESYTQAAYLHGGEPAIGKQEMLEIMLAWTPFGRERILAWGRQFAAHHGLDYEAALRASHAIGRDLKRRERLRQMINLFTTARVWRGDPRTMANVAEAAQVAEAILRSPPNRLVSAARALTARVLG